VITLVKSGWRFSAAVASFVTRTKLSPVSAGMGDRLWAGIPPRYVTKPSRSTQPCIPLGSLNRVPALIGWGKGGNVTSAGWQVTLCDPIWHVSSRSSVVLVAQTAIRFLKMRRIRYTRRVTSVAVRRLLPALVCTPVSSIIRESRVRFSDSSRFQLGSPQSSPSRLIAILERMSLQA